ncbi:MAG: hypothetical protein ACNA7V_15080, partial [Bacteroidales bacterium]
MKCLTILLLLPAMLYGQNFDNWLTPFANIEFADNKIIYTTGDPSPNCSMKLRSIYPDLIVQLHDHNVMADCKEINEGIRMLKQYLANPQNPGNAKTDRIRYLKAFALQTILALRGDGLPPPELYDKLGQMALIPDKEVAHSAALVTNLYRLIEKTLLEERQGIDYFELPKTPGPLPELFSADRIIAPASLDTMEKILDSIAWPKYYGQNNTYNVPHDVQESYDNGYFIISNFFSPGASNIRSSSLLKININGDTLWEKIVKNEMQFVNSRAIDITNDGGLLISGSLYRPGTGKSEPFVVKLNSCVEKEWCKIFSESPNLSVAAVDVRETPTGDVILLVNQYGVSPQETLHLFKLSGSGEVLWKNPFASGFVHPLGAYPYGWKVTITPDGKYLVAGSIYWPDPWNPGGPKSFRPLFFMVSPSGEEEWILPFGLNDTIRGEAMALIDGTGEKFIGVGYKKLNPYNEGLIMEFDAMGNEVNFRNINAKEIDTSFNRLLLYGAFQKDSLLILGGGMGVESTGSPPMEAISNLDIFSNLSFYKSIQHSDYSVPYTLGKTYNSLILSNSTFQQSSNWDIVLGKLNLNLEYDTAYPGVYTYDSLCTTPGLPQSGFIFLDDCDIITGMDIPSPE